jgi:hypothetical protein
MSELTDEPNVFGIATRDSSELFVIITDDGEVPEPGQLVLVSDEKEDGKYHLYLVDDVTADHKILVSQYLGEPWVVEHSVIANVAGRPSYRVSSYALSLRVRQGPDDWQVV